MQALQEELGLRLRYITDERRLDHPGCAAGAASLPREEGFAQQIGEKAQIRNQHSPIANLEHPSALSLAISRAAKLLIRLIVQGCSKLAIGECWLRIFGPSSSGAICCAKPQRGSRRSPSIENCRNGR